MHERERMLLRGEKSMSSLSASSLDKILYLVHVDVADLEIYNVCMKDYFPTCKSASSPISPHPRVGDVAKNPESDTSSTVSPMLSTRVAFRNDTTMYVSCWSENSI